MIAAQILEIRPAGARDAVPPFTSEADLARRFGLDRLPAQRTLVYMGVRYRLCSPALTTGADKCR